MDVDRIRMRWKIFRYNFGWPDYAPLLDGWIARCAMAIPFIGYLIIFNDTIANHISFDLLASESSSAFGLSSSARLKLIYLGLLILGISNILYRWKRPHPLRIATNEYDYVEKALKHFSVSAYIRLNEQIRYSNQDAFTQDGKYYDSDYEAFIEDATGRKPGVGPREAAVRRGHWNEAKSRHEGLLRSILRETFFRDSYHTRRGWLICCLMTSTIGYALLFLPSLDLFLKVLALILEPLLPQAATPL